MNVTVAIDSLKGSLTSMEAGAAVRDGILRVYPNAAVKVCPLADGGEGTAYALVSGMGGDWVQLQVTGPLGDAVECSYGILKENNTAILEMSAAAGITLIRKEARNPLLTTTYGVGEMIRDAIERGCRRFVIGIGGSATNDGGVGMLQALGFRFLDKNENQIRFGAQGLSELERIDASQVMPELAQCSFRIACDVTNPLCGTFGCSAVYGPQKGADADMIQKMDIWLAHYAELAQTLYPACDPEYPGTGAAGGLGFAFRTFLNAVLESGIQIVLQETELESYIKTSDVVITGEGRLDGQTVMGKAPIGVARLAKKYGKTVLAFAGCVTKDALSCNEAGVDAFFPILRSAVTLEEAMRPETAAANMADTAEQVFRLLRAVQ